MREHDIRATHTLSVLLFPFREPTPKKLQKELPRGLAYDFPLS